jgi:26S proteasome regulatory subunit N2
MREAYSDILANLFWNLSCLQDPIIRYGGMYVLGLAYRGTANNGAVQRLLHFAVSDVSDDVRRAAVLCLGFVLMNVPGQCPRTVALLAESFNPHVRWVDIYGRMYR